MCENTNIQHDEDHDEDQSGFLSKGANTFNTI